MDTALRKSSVAVSDSYFLKVDNSVSADSSSRSPSPNRSIKGLNLFRMISRKIGKSAARKAKEIHSSDEDDDSNSSSNSLPRNWKKTAADDDNGECDCDYLYKHDGRSILVLTSKNRSNSFTEHSVTDKSKDYLKSSERCLRFSTPCDGYHHSSVGSDAYSSNDDSSNSNDSDHLHDHHHHHRHHHFSSNDSSTSSSSGSYRNSRAIVRKVLKSLNLNSRSLSCSSISHIKDIPGGERKCGSAKEKRTKKSPQKILRQPVTYTYVRGISGLPTHRVVNTRGCYNNQYSRG